MSSSQKNTTWLIAIRTPKRKVKYVHSVNQDDTQKIVHAIPSLKKAAGNAFYLYNQKAQWFVILSYLKTGEIEKCRQSLATILTDKAHSYFEQATKLEAKLMAY